MGDESEERGRVQICRQIPARHGRDASTKPKRNPSSGRDDAVRAIPRSFVWTGRRAAARPAAGRRPRGLSASPPPAAPAGPARPTGPPPARLRARRPGTTRPRSRRRATPAAAHFFPAVRCTAGSAAASTYKVAYACPPSRAGCGRKSSPVRSGNRWGCARSGKACTYPWGARLSPWTRTRSHRALPPGSRRRRSRGAGCGAGGPLLPHSKSPGYPFPSSSPCASHRGRGWPNLATSENTQQPSQMSQTLCSSSPGWCVHSLRLPPSCSARCDPNQEPSVVPTQSFEKHWRSQIDC
mmetsp:Transcript_53138/g.152228  ORF Transcript_53138/g.152228 Transcript_53138/m.152228 type:complete len:296 (-) Transcript_53138:99-986(-)